MLARLLARLAALPTGSPLAAAKPRLPPPGRLGPAAARASSSLRPLDMGPPPPPPPLTRSAARAEQQALAAAQLQPEALRLDRVASNLAASCSCAPPAPPVSAKHAAVLVPLFEDAEGVVRVILTQRASSLPTHSGEVCLPGGKRDPGDADDAATALREAHEELGIPPAACRLLGALPPFLSKHLLSVRPCWGRGGAERCGGPPGGAGALATLAGQSREGYKPPPLLEITSRDPLPLQVAPVLAVVPSDLRFTPNPAEVAAVFAPPLHLFLRPGAAHSHRDVEWEPGIRYRLHFFDYFDPASGATFCIWGLVSIFFRWGARRLPLARHCCKYC